MYSIKELTEIVNEIVPGHPVKKVVLVGSYASETATEDSDADLVLDAENIADTLCTFFDTSY